MLIFAVVLVKQPWEIPTLSHDIPAATPHSQPEDLRQKIASLENRLAQWEATPPPLAMGNVAVKKSDTGWQLTDLFSRVRQYRRRILFAHPFAKPPQIMLGITLLDLPDGKIRFHARPEKIDAQGFTLLFETRSEARIEEVQVNWLALSN